MIGKITCQDLLSLKATAKPARAISTRRSSPLSPVRVFTGNCSMGGGVVKEMASPAMRPDAAGAPRAESQPMVR